MLESTHEQCRGKVIATLNTGSCETETIVVCLGDKRYRAERPWPRSSHGLHGLSDVVVLTDGRIAAAVRKTHRILIFTSQGELVDKWVIPGLVRAHYLYPDSSGGALVVDVDGHQIIAVDQFGTIRWTLGDPEHPMWMAPFNHPTSACYDSNGNLYVVDGYGNSCLHKFSDSLELIYTIGKQGQGMGQFTTPHAIVCTDEDDLIVADRENNRLQTFSTAGHAKGVVQDLYKPMAIHKTHDGNILVTDQTSRLSLLSPDGILLGRCRTLSTIAHGVSSSADGTIYLAEMAPDTITRLVPIS